MIHLNADELAKREAFAFSDLTKNVVGRGRV